MIPGRAGAEKTHRAAVDRARRIERRRALHLAAEAILREGFGAGDAGLGLTQTGQDFLGVVADGRNDAHPGHDNASHPTLAFLATCYRRRIKRRWLPPDPGGTDRP